MMRWSQVGHLETLWVKETLTKLEIKTMCDKIECNSCFDRFSSEFDDGCWVYDGDDSGNWLCNWCFGDSEINKGDSK